jgi:hypothetical protein
MDEEACWTSLASRAAASNMRVTCRPRSGRPSSFRGYGRTLSGFQLLCDPKIVFGQAPPSGSALWSARLLSPVATVCRLGSIKRCGGHDDPKNWRASTPGERCSTWVTARRPLLANCVSLRPHSLNDD